MSEWRKFWANGLPDTGKPKNQAIGWLRRNLFPRWWYGGLISANLEVIWEMSVERELGHLPEATRHKLVCGNAAKLYGFEL